MAQGSVSTPLYVGTYHVARSCKSPGDSDALLTLTEELKRLGIIS